MFNHISIIISTRNSELYIDKCISSALEQDYPNFKIIFFDADSTDQTYERVLKYKKDSRIQISKNEVRKYQGENIRNGVLKSQDKSIIVTLDGDDWFPHASVLARVNELYNENDCWMTYGTYEEYPYRDVSDRYEEYSLAAKMDKRFREHRWLATHLRTFRKELFLKIDEEDLKDPSTNDYFAFAPDLSFQFPMLEMCKTGKSLYVKDILYVYNVENPNNENKQNITEIMRIEKFIRSKPKYQTINEL